MENYKPNSHKSKEENTEIATQEKRAEKVVTAGVQVKKKSGFAKFADNFIEEDSRTVKDYIFKEVLKPALKKAISDMTKGAIDLWLYGDANVSRDYTLRNTNASRISYQSYYRDDRDYNRAPIRNYRTGNYDFANVAFDSMGDAQEVLKRMDEIMARYHLVRVADLYDLAGIAGTYTDNDWGWMDIQSASVSRTYDGKYIIRLPKAMPLD